MAADPIACGSSVLRAIPNSQPLRGQEFGNSGIWESRRSRPAASPAFCHSEAAAEESPPLDAVERRRDPSLRLGMTKARGGCRNQPLVVAACSGRFPNSQSLRGQEFGNSGIWESRRHRPAASPAFCHSLPGGRPRSRRISPVLDWHRTGGRSFTAVQDDKGTGWLPTLSLVVAACSGRFPIPNP